jgi:hypothetical protein
MRRFKLEKKLCWKNFVDEAQMCSSARLGGTVEDVGGWEDLTTN